MQVSKTIDRISIKFGTGEASIESYVAKKFLKAEKFLKFFALSTINFVFPPRVIFLYLYTFSLWSIDISKQPY
jgi:hypothetical protein